MGSTCSSDEKVKEIYTGPIHELIIQLDKYPTSSELNSIIREFKRIDNFLRIKTTFGDFVVE